jgi:hypothetical protein
MLETKIFMKFYGLKVQYGLNLDHTKSRNDILFPVSFMPNQLKVTFFVLTEQTKNALSQNGQRDLKYAWELLEGFITFMKR